MPDNGAQFLRASDSSSQFGQVLQMLAQGGILAPWKGRFGVLGSRAGGFLPVEAIAGAGMLRSSVEGGGDFCCFVSESSQSPAFVGVPSNAAICAAICTGIEVQEATCVSAVRCTANGWHVESSRPDCGARFDAAVLATHDPSLAAATVRSLVSDAEEEDLASRLRTIAELLQSQRERHRAPVFSLSAVFPSTSLSRALPFDAVSVPNSQLIQFLARDGSRPGRVAHPAGELYTAVSTSHFAQQLLQGTAHLSSAAQTAAATDALTGELRRLVAPFFGDESAVPSPVQASAKRWGAAFASQTMGLKEDSLVLAPWRFAVCGDFLKEHTSPIEAAALSGLEAGERVAALLS